MEKIDTDYEQRNFSNRSTVTVLLKELVAFNHRLESEQCIITTCTSTLTNLAR